MKSFIFKAIEHKVQQKIFSEDVDPVPQYYNDSIRKISRNNLSYYFADHPDRDCVVLFYASECQLCNEALKKFIEFSKMIY